MIRSDSTNAFDGPVGGKLNEDLGDKADFEPEKRFQGGLCSHFAEQIDRGGADVQVDILFDDFDEPALHIRLSSRVENIDGKNAHVGIGVGKQGSQRGRYIAGEKADGLDDSLRSAASSLRRHSAMPAAADGWRDEPAWSK